jgi:hypothetical protein|tara:strand:- start:113 stop:334 length:222 start_codon:yes stop_codon:yes gene_type:complete
MAQTRMLKHIDTIIGSQFNKGDIIDSRIMHGRIMDTYGTKYLPNRPAIAMIMGRSKLVTRVSSKHEVVEFKVL